MLGDHDQEMAGTGGLGLSPDRQEGSEELVDSDRLQQQLVGLGISLDQEQIPEGEEPPEEIEDSVERASAAQFRLSRGSDRGKTPAKSRIVPLTFAPTDRNSPDPFEERSYQSRGNEENGLICSRNGVANPPPSRPQLPQQDETRVAIRPIAAPEFEPISAFDLIRGGRDEEDQESQVSAEDAQGQAATGARGGLLVQQKKRARFAGSSQNQYIEPSTQGSSVAGSQINDGLSDVFAGVGNGFEDQANQRVAPDEDDPIILCLAFRKKRLGAAAYAQATRVLSLLPECSETETYHVTAHVISQLRPTRIITSARSDEPYLDLLRSANVALEIRPSGEFAQASSLNRLLALRVIERDGEGPPCDRQEASAWIAGVLGGAEGETVSAAGGLLMHLQRELLGDREDRSKKRGRKRLEEEEREESGEVEVERVVEMRLEAHVQVSEETLRALSIFIDDRHPSMHFSSRKEGLSLFGLLDTTLTPLGKRLLRSWFLRPCAEPVQLQRRHDAVALFARPENEHVAGQLRSCLKQITDLRKVIRSLKTAQPTIADFQALLRFCYYCIKIRSHLRELPRASAVEVVSKIHAIFDAAALRELGALINEVCDFDKTKEEGRFVVKSGIDEELDEMKRTYEGLDSLLGEVAREVAETIQVPDVTKLNCIYFPQLGFLVTIPLQPDWKTASDFEIEGLQYQFCTANTVYYKSDKMRELDSVLGDIHGLIADREIEIIHQLSEKFLEHASSLVHMCDLTAELDCTLAFAAAARKYNYVRPTMTESNVLVVRKGRHLLAELVSETFVSNDVRFDDPAEELDGAARIVMLSGANCSGKSTYLKQIALIVFMAHIGSFVPAESAVVGYTDRILTRIQTRETVAKNESAFLRDIIQVNQALRNSTSRSLVLLDEFGKGTVTSDGIGILCGVLEHFADRLDRCPKVLCATHFHEIFVNELLRPSPMITYNVMDIMQAQGTRELTFLYRVIEGRTTRSFGNFVAAIAGVPLEVVERSEEVSAKFAKFEPVETKFNKEAERKFQLAEAVADAFEGFDLEGPAEAIEGFLDTVCREADKLKI